jgi:peptidoglycan/LPS O-acetylase OafA/YrhL
MASLPNSTNNPAEQETTEIGWQWSEMTWRARFVLLSAIMAGAALVLGVLIIATELDTDSPLRRGLFALLLIPFGIAGAAARTTKKSEKAQRSSRSKVMSWLILIGVLAVCVIGIALIGAFMAD